MCPPAVQAFGQLPGACGCRPNAPQSPAVQTFGRRLGGRSAILPSPAYTLRYGAILRMPVCNMSFPELTKLLANYQGFAAYLLGCLRKTCRGMGKLGNSPLTAYEVD